MINSRTKGKNGELELAHYLTDRGFPARRGQQFKGSPDTPDVLAEGLEEFHIECKRIEQGNPYVWLEQAVTDAQKARTPVVMHRKSREAWVAILYLEDFLELVKLARTL